MKAMPSKTSPAPEDVRGTNHTAQKISRLRHTLAILRREYDELAIAIKGTEEELRELESVVGEEVGAPAAVITHVPSPAAPAKPKRKMSMATRKKLQAAAKARWAQQRGETAATEAPKASGRKKAAAAA